MTLLALLAAGPQAYRGRGVNHEGESFVGTLKLQPVVGGQGLILHYEAKVDGDEVVHTESTLWAPDMDGTATLWPVMSELPGVLPHKAIRQGETEATFASGPREDRTVFREEISISLVQDGSVTYTHAWGLPGGEFKDRSSCRMWPSDD